MPVLGNIVTGGLRMSKFISKSARKRIPMTPKMGNKNFYKGTGSTKEGHLTSRGMHVFFFFALFFFFPREFFSLLVRPKAGCVSPSILATPPSPL